jgi:hypothetical protein
MGQRAFNDASILELIDRTDFQNTIQRPLEFEFEGSPYLNDEFEKGDVYYNNAWRFSDIPLRYNIYNDEMEYKEEDRATAYSIKPISLINAIVIKKDSFIVANYYEKRKPVACFFKILTSGKVDLLAKLEVEFEEAQPAKPFFAPEPAKFTRRDDKYYIKTSEYEVWKISNIKKLIEMIGEHEKELSQYAKKEKISAGNESELIRFISFYNSL